MSKDYPVVKEAPHWGGFLILSPLGINAATLALGNEGLVLNQPFRGCCFFFVFFTAASLSDVMYALHTTKHPLPFPLSTFPVLSCTWDQSKQSRCTTDLGVVIVLILISSPLAPGCEFGFVTEEPGIFLCPVKHQQQMKFTLRSSSLSSWRVKCSSMCFTFAAKKTVPL